MDRITLIDSTVKMLSQLPDEKLREVNDFAEFLLSRIDDSIILEGVQQLNADSKSFEYLQDEEDIYTVNDLKERYR